MKGCTTIRLLHKGDARRKSEVPDQDYARQTHNGKTKTEIKL